MSRGNTMMRSFLGITAPESASAPESATTVTTATTSASATTTKDARGPLTKAKGTKSWVHDYFLVYTYMIGVANCCLCQQDGVICDIAWRGSTSTLTQHVKGKHRAVFAAEKMRQAEAEADLPITATKEMSILNFIIHAGLPKETVENDAFNEMMMAHVPNYKRMGEYRLMTLLSKKYADVKVSLAGILKNTRGAVTCTLAVINILRQRSFVAVL